MYKICKNCGAKIPNEYCMDICPKCDTDLEF